MFELPEGMTIAEYIEIFKLNAATENTAKILQLLYSALSFLTLVAVLVFAAVVVKMVLNFIISYRKQCTDKANKVNSSEPQ